MYTASDLYDYASLYYLQALMSYEYSPPWNRKQVYAHRCLLYTIAANMIYEGRY